MIVHWIKRMNVMVGYTLLATLVNNDDEQVGGDIIWEDISNFKGQGDFFVVDLNCRVQKRMKMVFWELKF
jgi:hypothetical protein